MLDFHEAYDFNKINNSSVGSALLPANNYSDKTIFPKLQNICDYIIDKINKTIDDDSKKFTVITNDSYDIKNTLRDYCEHINKPYILVEITGQNNKQPLSLRKLQTKIILKECLKK